MKTSHHLSRRVSHVFRENLRLSKEKKNQIIPTVRLLKKRVRFRSPFGIQFEKKKKRRNSRRNTLFTDRKFAHIINHQISSAGKMSSVTDRRRKGFRHFRIPYTYTIHNFYSKLGLKNRNDFFSLEIVFVILCLIWVFNIGKLFSQFNG